MMNRTRETFTYQTQNTRKLNETISVLCEPQFNPNGLARIDVDSEGLHFTVFNAETRIFGHLRLMGCNPWMQGSNWDEFVFNQPFIPRMVDLNLILSILALGGDRIVRITHVIDSDELRLSFASNPSTVYPVELLELSADFRQFPLITGLCGILIPSHYLRQMIPVMLQDQNPQNVSVEMTAENMNITIADRIWYAISNQIQIWKTRVEFRRHFQWPHRNLLIDTSHLSENVFLCFLDDPADSVMFQFSITETWDLSLVTSCTPIYNLNIFLRPVTPLKHAVRSLIHTTSSLTPTSVDGMIQFDNTSFQIVVRESDTGVIGILQLLPNSVVGFKCRNPIERKMVNLKHVTNSLLRAGDADWVVVHQVEGCNEINIKTCKLDCLLRNTGPFGIASSAVKLVEIDDNQFHEYPDNRTVACEAFIPSEDLRKMIPLMVRDKTPQTVTLQIACGFVTIFIGEDSWDCDYNEQIVEQEHRVSFEWPNPESLIQASYLATRFSISILSNPPDSIMLRFVIPDAGYLCYIKKVSLLPDLITRHLLDADALPI